MILAKLRITKALISLSTLQAGLRLCCSQTPKTGFHLTLTLRLHKILPYTLYILIPMHMQTLKLLRPAVLVEMYLQENTVFDLDLGIKVT